VHTLAAGSFTSALGGFLDELRSRHSSASYVRQAERVLAVFLSHLRENGIDDVHEVRHEDVAAWLRELRERRTRRGALLSSWTQADYFDIVRVFFASLVKRSGLFVSPVGELCVRRHRSLPRAVLSEAEARRLVHAPLPVTALGVRDRAILETLYGTGIRAGECAGLAVMDLDIAAGELLVRDGKGRKDRRVPLVGRARKAVSLYLDVARQELLQDPRETTLFLSRQGRRLGTAGLRRIVKTAARAARISRTVTTHGLRHTCATQLVRGGADIRYVQEILGHRSVQTTAIYTRVAIEDLRRVIARCHPRGRR
jgi:integrase/recombinase XerD